MSRKWRRHSIYAEFSQSRIESSYENKKDRKLRIIEITQINILESRRPYYDKRKYIEINEYTRFINKNGS